MVKPFDVLELLARVDGVLHGHGKLQTCIQIGDLEINTLSMQVRRNGKEVMLTRKEYELLLLFAQNIGVVVALGREDGFGSTAKPDRLHIGDLAVYLYRLVQDWLHPPCVICRGQWLSVLGRVGNQYTLFDATGMDVHSGDQVELDGNLMLSSCERRFV